MIITLLVGCAVEEDPTARGRPPPADSPPASETASLEDVLEAVSPGVALILVLTPEGPGLGSGFVVHELGYIVTNHHVISGAVGGAVKLASGDMYEGFDVVALDPMLDLAVIRVSAYGVPVLELGNSDSVRVGAPVVALGNPLGLEGTVTTGVISGQRSVNGVQVFQLDAPISPGSSGGPILLPDGRVIAVTVGQMEEGQNLNFAIPINYARGLLAAMSGEALAVVPPIDERDFAAWADSGVGALSDLSIEDYEEVKQRVTFGRGEDAAFLTGEIFPYQIRTYVLEAMADQLMRVELEATDTVALRIESPGEQELEFQEGDSLLSALRLYETGSYAIGVVARESAARYKILVEIR